jgi:hypothetical protein
VIFYDGGWWRGPFRHRHWRGHDWYWVNNGWHRNEWRGRVPHNVSFRNGGYYRGGRYGGFHGSEHFGRSHGSFRGNSGSFHGHSGHSGGGHHNH